MPEEIINITIEDSNEAVNITVDETTEQVNITIGETQPVKTSDLINDGEDGVHPFITLEDIPAGAVESVTGDLVDNTDPANPVINNPTLAEVLTEGNLTGGENIVINDADAIQLENASTLKKGTYDFGADGGISRICGVGYEDMWQSGFRHVFDSNGLIRHSTNCFNVIPDSSFDVTLRFKIDSFWTLDNGDTYKCTDATEGAAVWELVNIGIIPNLQEVTTAGNETSNPIKVIDTGNTSTQLQQNGLFFEDLDDLGNTYILFDQTSVANQEVLVRGLGGTMALLSDIPAAQVNSDWNATSGVEEILNKPTIPDAQIQSDWTQANTSALDYIKNKPTIPTNTSDLTNDGADGVNPFITALDIPTTGQASTLVREVKNMTGATLTKGTVVYISGANGNKALVSKALATTDALSSRTFGLLQSNISNNGLGYCVIIGDLSGLNTSSFSEGDQLYLSGVTAGTYTATKILAPTHLVYVGKVTRSHPTQGQIEVGIQNGYELSEIHDVALSSEANNQALVYETSTDLWKNKTIIEDSITNGVTTIAPSQNAVFDALALKQNALSYTPYRFTAPSQIVHTGVVTETILQTILIPANTFTNGDFIMFSAIVSKLANISNTSHSIKINTTNTLIGAASIAIIGFNTVNFFMKFKREFVVNGGNIYGHTTALGTPNDQGTSWTTQVVNTATYNLGADLYFFVTCTLSNILETITYRGINLYKQ